MKLQRQIDQLIAHRASEWVEILKTGGPQEREAFVDWLRESRKHVSEFLAMAVLDDELNQTVFKDLVDKKALLERVSPHMSELQKRHSDERNITLHRSSSRSNRRRWPLAIAAGVAATALAVTLALQSFSPMQEFTTGASEKRAVELADGSVVLLNSASRVQVRLKDESRDLQLVQGEALFKVAKDPQRPFRVRARDVVIQAVGTQFNVNARKATTIVSVLEGKVLVSKGHTQEATPLRAGEEASAEPNGKIDRRTQIDVEKAASWRERRVVFKEAAIEDVVREFNRHNANPKLRVEGIEAGSLHYSAIFHTDDPESFADFLKREGDVAIEKRADEIVIRPR